MKEGAVMTIEEMRQKKAEQGWTNRELSRESGVPLGTLQKIFSGETKAPRRKTLEALEDVLDPREYRSSRSLYNYPSRAAYMADLLREETAPYNVAMDREWHTVDEYYMLPDDRRVELIDGVFYDMGAPTKAHQGILGELYLQFRACADRHAMPCEVWLSPCDVRLDRDNYTMIQPDLFVICGDHEAPGAVRFEGAPDLVVEIVSPSSVKRDKYTKLHKYADAGVREYWIVDPKKRKVTVYLLEKDSDPEVYSFRDTIPIGLSEGTCGIDFSLIEKRVERYL